MKKIIYTIIILLLLYSSSNSQIYKWYQIQSGTNVNLNSVNQSVIAGASGTILYSSNSGFNWILKNSGTNNDLYSIYFGTYYYISGANGTMLKSNDGNTWTVLNTGSNKNLNSVTRGLNFNSIYAVGNSGTILYSSDGGTIWSTMTSGTANDLNSIAYSGYNGWIVGKGGIILATTNSGSNWFQQVSGTSSNLNFIRRNDNNNLWVVGDNGKILCTTNGGTNWLNKPSGTSANLKSLTYSSSTMWSVGTGGVVLTSTNNGSNWTIQQGFPNLDLNSVYFFTPDNGIIVGNNGSIFLRGPDSTYFNYVNLKGNNINAFFYNTGIFDQDKRTSNTPGFEWPIGTGQDALFTCGLSTAAYVNGILKMASAMYAGEYAPGYVTIINGVPMVQTDSRFHFYKVKRGDNQNNPDWLHWVDMIPFGAPYDDINNNGVFDPGFDIPGVKNAAQTIFLCMTDGFPENHNPSEGFGGGTPPMFAESHMTAWCYDNPDLMDVQFIKWEVINKNIHLWNSTYFSITCDPDLGCADDDYIGCDTIRKLGFCYNGEDVDCNGPYRYSGIPPSVGILMLNSSGVQNLGMSSFDFFTNPGSGGPVCERDPNPDVPGAYNYMKGLKSDATPWVIPPGGQNNVTKFCYSGDPETGQGWCESGGTISGSIQNCGGPSVFTGIYVPSNSPGDRRMVLNSGSNSLTINPGDTQRIIIAQLIARGVNRKNSVTKLKILADTVRAVYNRGFIIDIQPISTEIPNSSALSQNYPNPFNPSTIIKFDIAKTSFTKLIVYDILGREVTILVNEELKPGNFEVEWNAGNFASGIYFYSLTTESFNQTKRMVLIK